MSVWSVAIYFSFSDFLSRYRWAKNHPQVQGHQLQQDHQQFAESFPVVCGLVVAAAAAAAAAAQHRQLLRRRGRLQGGKVRLAPGGRDGAGDPEKNGGSERVPWRSRKWLDVLRICL